MLKNNRIRRVLVANRGEIAVRIMRTCRRLGIECVAVFSDADRSAPHVQMADEAYHIGSSPSAESYLRIDRIIDVARRSGSDAIHPGYGFLAENAAFARACLEADITFIGPSPEAIEMMADKTAARSIMGDMDVPVLPGTVDAVQGEKEGVRVATAIGLPVIIKAASGGGGKGMRIVEKESDLGSMLQQAQSEAQSAFGDGRVFIEKYIPEPRHVEIQILADQHGNMVHLFERECSIQRRYQKVVEEAPSPAVTPALRERMGEAAINAAKACGYVGAGTVEFLLDSDGSFYFMEMNTRLQVEHPVTEEITGLDLVEKQIRIAEGESLGFSQDQLSIDGHAIECRIYAEDPYSNFLPDPGWIQRHAPPGGIGVRVDSGCSVDGRVEIYYDPMISKLIAWGPDRSSAIDRMTQALQEYDVVGVRTTIPFCRDVMQDEDFREGKYSTRFVEDRYLDLRASAATDQIREAAALAAVLIERRRRRSETRPSSAQPARSRWIRRRA